MPFSKIYLLIVFLWFSCPLLSKEDSKIDLAYTIRPVKVNNEIHLEVQMKFNTENQQETYLFLPSTWAGQEKLYREIVHLKCLSKSVSLEATDRQETLKLSHKPYEQVELKYFVKSTHSQSKDWYYRPIIEKNHFYFFGHSFFIFPQMDFKKPVHVTLQWKDFPKHWSLANSFGAEEHTQKLYLPLRSFQHAVFAGGDFKLVSCGNKNSQILVAVRGEWSFSMEHFTELLKTIIEGQREFWHDTDFPYYLVTLMKSKSDHTTAGTALNRAFSLFIYDFPEESLKHWNSLAWLLSHEHFHTWNGLKMEARSEDESMMWFTEGFTEYYALELNLEG